MVSRNTTLVPFLGLCIGPACEAGLSVGMRRERVPPQRIKIKIKYNVVYVTVMTRKNKQGAYCYIAQWHLMLLP